MKRQENQPKVCGETLLRQGHWVFEDFKQRMTAREWKQLLLQEADQVIFKGNLRPLVARKLGYGVVEVSKSPMKRN